VLALGAIGSGIITSALEEEEEEGGETAEPAAAEGWGNALRLRANPGGESRFDGQTLRAWAHRAGNPIRPPWGLAAHLPAENRRWLAAVRLLPRPAVADDSGRAFDRSDRGR
jgi:hypothetical protein